MKNKYIWIFVIILIILNTLLLWRTNKYKNNYNTLSEYLSKQKNNVSGFSEFYYDIIKDQYKSNGLKIDINQCIVNSNGDSITLDKITENGSKLIYNFKKVTCKICVDDELKRLKSISERIGKNNVLLVFDYNTLREMYILEKNLDFTLYDISDFGFNLPIDSKLCPYIFILDSNLVVNDLFIPTKNNKLRDIYFKTVLNKHW